MVFDAFTVALSKAFSDACFASTGSAGLKGSGPTQKFVRSQDCLFSKGPYLDTKGGTSILICPFMAAFAEYYLLVHMGLSNWRASQSMHACSMKANDTQLYSWCHTNGACNLN